MSNHIKGVCHCCAGFINLFYESYYTSGLVWEITITIIDVVTYPLLPMLLLCIISFNTAAKTSMCQSHLILKAAPWVSTIFSCHVNRQGNKSKQVLRLPKDNTANKCRSQYWSPIVSVSRSHILKSLILIDYSFWKKTMTMQNTYAITINLRIMFW